MGIGNGLLWLYYGFVMKRWEVENGHAEGT
jgi:hypothetical protein